MAIRSLQQFLLELPNLNSHIFGRLRCQPLLVVRDCMPRLHVGPESIELPLVNHSGSGTFRSGVNLFQSFEPPAKLLPHAATNARSCAMAANVRPSPSSVACLPVKASQRRTITSTYFGSSSTP